MAKVIQQSDVQLSVLLKLSEPEARALDALVGYGFDSFIKVFYEHLGKHYMEPHEAGLRSLFESVRKEIPPVLGRADKARLAFKG